MTLRWGLVATIKAPTADVLNFAAWHIERGAHRLYIYLDDANINTFQLLKAHPKVRPILCDADYWQGKRPRKHQVRQGRNATHAYNRRAEVDWMIHMDADEFLVSEDVSRTLGQLPATQLIARIRPMEQLAGNGQHFKGFIPAGPDRARISAALYPTYGAYLKGGFLSHLAGKVFVRTGMSEVRIQIHNAFLNDAEIEGPNDTPGIDLAHCHASNWDHWLAAYRFRHAEGSYRPGLAPNLPRDKGGLAMHELFQTIEAEGGEAALRAFFDEVCTDTPALRERLAHYGFLRTANLSLNDPIVSHFPGFAP